jgi:DNA-binding beta-propeller fold protein YncE
MSSAVRWGRAALTARTGRGIAPRCAVFLIACAGLGCADDPPVAPVPLPPPLTSGSPPPAVLVLNTLSETISRLDLATGTMVVQAALAGTWTNRIDAAAGGRLLLVANSGSNEVALLDGGSLVPAGAIDVGAGKSPWLAREVQDGRALVSNWLASEVRLLDLRERRVGEGAATTPGPEGFAVVGDTAFVACTNYQGAVGAYGEGHVDVVDLSVPRVVASIVVSTNPQHVVLGSHGLLHVVCTGDYTPGAPGRVDVVDRGSLAVVASIPVDGSPGCLAEGPDGAMWVAGYSGGIHRYDPGSRQLLDDPIDPALDRTGLAAIAADLAAGRIYVAAFDDDLLFAVDAASRQVVGEWAVGDGPVDVLVVRPNP